jgi:hypothetical protein
LLWAEIVANGAGYGGSVRFMAVDARFHLYGHKGLMARFAVGRVFGMTEKHEVRKHANGFFRHDFHIFRQMEFRVARLAFLSLWKRGALGDLVAGDALHL